MSIVGKIIIVLYLQTINDTIFKVWLFILFAIILIWIAMEVIYRSQTRSIILKYPHKH
jgi:sulfite exporter TauE/SafE